MWKRYQTIVLTIVEQPSHILVIKENKMRFQTLSKVRRMKKIPCLINVVAYENKLLM